MSIRRGLTSRLLLLSVLAAAAVPASAHAAGIGFGSPVFVDKTLALREVPTFRAAGVQVTRLDLDAPTRVVVLDLEGLDAEVGREAADRELVDVLRLDL